MGLGNIAMIAAICAALAQPAAATAFAAQATPAAATPADARPTPPPSNPSTPAGSAAVSSAPAGSPVPTTQTAASAETPPPSTAAPATDVVTLVAWYANDPSGEFLNILPIDIDPALVAAGVTGSQPLGQADFPDEGAPTVRLGETEFVSYPRSEGDIPERWTWFDDYEGARPATLVLQIEGQGGPYSGYFGAVTFISRDEGGVGGVIVFALRPPGSRERAEAARAAEESSAAADGEDAGLSADSQQTSEPDPANPDQADPAA